MSEYVKVVYRGVSYYLPVPSFQSRLYMLSDFVIGSTGKIEKSRIKLEDILDFYVSNKEVISPLDSGSRNS